MAKKDGSDDLEKWGADIIFGRARGFWPAILRGVLFWLSLVYRVGVKVRLLLYRDGWKARHSLATMVVSIGNITVGGTGKTPVVERFARQLTERGRKVAILSRGYKSADLEKPQRWISPVTGKLVKKAPKIVSDGKEVLLEAKYAGDEPHMLARNLPGVAVVVDRDRVKGGLFAVQHLGVDLLLLDDGMQYLPLVHNLDVVLVDQGSPFGTGQILPRGTLREPPGHLRRADYVFITKCDGSKNTELRKKILEINPTAELMDCTHGPVHLSGVFHDEILPLSELEGKYVAAISGIAMPESFDRLLRDLGAQVEFHTTFADHHNFTRGDVDRFMKRCLRRSVDMIVTTEKDAVRFPRPSEADVPIYFLRIEIDILEGEETWSRCLERICDVPSPSPLERTRQRMLKQMS